MGIRTAATLLIGADGAAIDRSIGFPHSSQGRLEMLAIASPEGSGGGEAGCDPGKSGAVRWWRGWPQVPPQP